MFLEVQLFPHFRSLAKTQSQKVRACAGENFSDITLGCCSVTKSCLTLQPHGLQHARPPLWTLKTRASKRSLACGGGLQYYTPPAFIHKYIDRYGTFPFVCQRTE